MNLQRHYDRALLVSLFCAIGFGVVAVLVYYGKFARIDTAIITVIQGAESPLLTSIFLGFTLIGGGIPAVVMTVFLLGVLYKVLRLRAELLFMIGVVGGSWLLNESLKLVFQRARPTIHRMIDVGGFSFPSGHSMAAFSLYGIVAFLLFRHARNARFRKICMAGSAAMILAIGISRIYLGVHYPSDVIGGFLASGSWMAFSVWLSEKYFINRAGNWPAQVHSGKN